MGALTAVSRPGQYRQGIGEFTRRRRTAQPPRRRQPQFLSEIDGSTTCELPLRKLPEQRKRQSVCPRVVS